VIPLLRHQHTCMLLAFDCIAIDWHLRLRALARQKYWKIGLRVVEPKIPAFCDFKTSKDYKKARQVRGPSKIFL
jgi:hypothetical protein